jgi:hypothetical protein
MRSISPGPRALPEEMPVHELLELDAGLDEAVGRSLDLVVVDGVYPNRFTDAEARRLEKLAAGSGRVLAAHRQARAHAERVHELRRRIQAPVVTLPFVFETELGIADYVRLARRLCGS